MTYDGNSVYLVLAIVIVIVVILIILVVNSQNNNNQNSKLRVKEKNKVRFNLEDKIVESEGFKINFSYHISEENADGTTTFTPKSDSKILTIEDFRNARICLGTKNVADEVRSIKIRDDTYIPPYDNKPKWSRGKYIDDISSTILIYGYEMSIFKDTGERFIDTAGACLGTNFNDRDVSGETFKSMITQIYLASLTYNH